MEIRMLDEFESARMMGVEVDLVSHALEIKCMACGRRGKCGSSTPVKKFSKQTGWRYIHKAGSHENEGWICPSCLKKELVNHE